MKKLPQLSASRCSGKFITKYFQFGRPSGVFIDKKDNLYVGDSESVAVSRNHLGWKNGMHMGDLRDGKVEYFIPDPAEAPQGTSAAEGVAIDAYGRFMEPKWVRAM